MGKLDGKITIVTGATSGIGRRTVEIFVAEGAKVLARYQGDPVLVEAGKHLVATFHPELTADSRVHQLFLEKL